MKPPAAETLQAPEVLAAGGGGPRLEGWALGPLPEEAAMQRISEVDRPGLVLRAFYKIGERLFGAVPTPERIMAHRMPLLLGIGALWGAMEWCATLDRAVRALVQLRVAELYGSVY
jgi:hypothetical protein